jgi:sirohydrochlorin cobaltochelatase
MIDRIKRDSMKKGILLCGHGSRKKGAVDAFKKLVAILKDRYGGEYEVDYGFLEFNHPLYEAAVERMYERGIRTIYALPVILFAGAHAKNDIPYELNTIQTYYDDLTIKMASPIGVNSFLLELAKKRIEETEATLTPLLRRETCLIVVGRGTTDPDANSDVNKLMSMLWDGMGFGFATTAYSGTAYPSVQESLQMVDKLGFKRTIVIPFFFFTGILLDRIYARVEEMNAASPHAYVYTEPFGTDELMLKAFDERLEQAIEGVGNMNCQLCKYRKQIIGFEQEQGQEQIGHHLNVKGVLFEEDEKVGEKKNSLGSRLKKVLGI